MPRVSVELSDKEIKEIIFRTKKNVAEGIRELLFQNRERVSLTEEQLREMVNSVVFSHVNNLLSELKSELKKTAEKLPKVAVDEKKFVARDEFEKTRSAILKEIDKLKNELASFEREYQRNDTKIRINIARTNQELEKLKEKLSNLQPDISAVFENERFKEVEGQARGAAYWTSQLMFTVGRLIGRVNQVSERLNAIERGERNCSLVHRSKL